MIGLLVACVAPDLEVALVPGEWTPAAARVEWEGPAGEATLYVDGGAFSGWREHGRATVAEGRSGMALTLLPAGSWRYRIEVDDGERIWESAAEPLEVPDPPEGLADVSLLQRRGESELAEGYWVGYRFGYRWNNADAIPVILNGDGEVVWWLPPDPDGGLAMRVRPSADLASILVLEDFEDPLRRTIHRYSLDGMARTTTAAPEASHDFWENEDGTFTYVAYTYSAEELVPNEHGPAAADVLLTVAEGSTDGSPVDVGFDFFADFPRDPWYPCDHADYDFFVPGAAEWSHVNSLMSDPGGPGWLVVVRHFDAVLAVDGPERLWQAGGEDATLLATTPEANFEHGHASHAWTGADGRTHLLVFDNGTHGALPIVSRIVELAFDPGAGTVEAVWSLDDPAGEYTGWLGDARRLPGGNTVVAWTPRGVLAEYTPEGEEVWSVALGAPTGRGFFVPAFAP